MTPQPARHLIPCASAVIPRSFHPDEHSGPFCLGERDAALPFSACWCNGFFEVIP